MHCCSFASQLFTVIRTLNMVGAARAVGGLLIVHAITMGREHAFAKTKLALPVCGVQGIVYDGG